MRFGVGYPTCREGTTYPVPYVRPEDFLTIAQRAEALGYYSLWGNDHLTPPHNVRSSTDEPTPNFYEPLIVYSALAYVTKTIRFVVGVLVLPEREPVLLAKQISTLDVLSGGRLMLGVGLGGAREEFEAVHPKLAGANRGRMVDEGIEAMRELFNERRASYQGRYLQFSEVELAPKPVQSPFPIYVSGRSGGAMRRIAKYGDGWISASVSAEELARSRQEIASAAAEFGRDSNEISINFQIWLAFGRDRDEAIDKMRRSPNFLRRVRRNPELSVDELVEAHKTANLLGDPDDVIEQIRVFEQNGVSHMGIIFMGETLQELYSDMELFAGQVMPAFQ